MPSGRTPRVVHFGIFRHGTVSLCESPTLLRVVGAGFTKNYNFYEGYRFVFAAMNL